MLKVSEAFVGYVKAREVEDKQRQAKKTKERKEEMHASSQQLHQSSKPQSPEDSVVKQTAAGDGLQTER